MNEALDNIQAHNNLSQTQNDSLLNWWLEFVDAGGPIVVVLVVMSIIALAITLYKVWQFHLVKLSNRKTAIQVIDYLKKDQVHNALMLSESSPNPTLQAMWRAINGRHRKLPDALIREEIQRYGSDALFQLRSGFRPLEVIASLAPLLGLLGTVQGMIEAFKQMEAAGSKVNPAVLSGGIWEALLTTAVGLLVAVPVIVVLNWLERRVDRVAHDIENFVTQIFTLEFIVLLENSVVNENAVNGNTSDARKFSATKSEKINKPESVNNHESSTAVFAEVNG